MMVRFTIIFYYLWVDISALTHSQTWFRWKYELYEQHV